MRRKFRVGLVGCGAIANTHLTYLNETDLTETVALCDIDIEKARITREKYRQNAQIYQDYLDMLDNADLDAVHITTPHHLHANMAIEALKRNINVVLEKPICISVSEIEKLLLAEKESKAKITVCFQNRMNASTVLALKEASEDGGALKGHGSVFWYRTNEYYTESQWRGRWATEGGGVLINQAIHTLDLLCQFLGKPTSVIANISTLEKKAIIEVEDTANGIIYFEGGKRANFYATTTCVGKGMTSVVIETKNNRIEINSPNRLYINGDRVTFENEDVTYIGKQCYGNGHKTLISDFYTALKDATCVPVTLESSTYALRILLAAYKSNGEKIDI